MVREIESEGSFLVCVLKSEGLKKLIINNNKFMKKYIKTITFASLALLLLIPLVSMASSEIELANKGTQMKAQFKDGNLANYETREARRAGNQARHSEMLNILEQNDYQAWLEFVGDKDCPMKEKINEENFAEFVKAHQDRVSEREARQEFRGGNRK